MYIGRVRLFKKMIVTYNSLYYMAPKCSYSNFNIRQLLPRPCEVHTPLAQNNINSYI